MLKLQGKNAEKVIELLKKRRGSNYNPANGISDGSKIGLILEGGGMRGVIGCAAVDTLFQLGFGNCFDIICGTSAGSINGAYFISGQINMGTSIYYENLTCKKFINLMKYPDIMNLDYLFDEWLMRGKKLDTSKVINSKMPLYITATNVDTGQLEYFCSQELTTESLFKALKASSSPPLFTDNHELINGNYYNDGMIKAAIPADIAIKRGCTHLVYVLTREVGFKKSQSKIIKVLESLRLHKYSRAYLTAFHNRISTYNISIDKAYGGSEDQDTLVIAPTSKEDIIGNGEIEEGKVRKASMTAMENVADIIDEKNIELKMYS